MIASSTGRGRRRILALPVRGKGEVVLPPRARFGPRAEFEVRTWEVSSGQIAVDGRSPAEVAAALELSLPAVYKAKSRVLRRLRQELEGLDAG